MRRILALAGVALLLLGGCSSGVPVPGTSTDAAFDQLLAQVRTGMNESVTSFEQRATLEEIARTGEVTFEQYRTAHIATIECIENAGLTVSEPYTYNERGVEVVNADVTQPPGMTDDAFFALLDACEEENSVLIDRIYFFQPSAVDAWATLIESHRTEILECFTSQGAEFEDDVTVSEMEGIREDIVLTQLEAHGSNPPPVDCFDVAGIIWPEG